MRITHVIHAFPPFSRAGSENYCLAVAKRQAADHEVRVFHRIADPERPEYEVTEGECEGLPVTRINRIFSDAQGFRDTYEAPALAAKFGEFLDREQPDVVHFHHITCLSTTCVAEAKRRGIAVVYTLHDFWLFCSRGQLYREDLTLCTRHTPKDCVRCMAYHLPIEGGGERIASLLNRARDLEGSSLPRGMARWLGTRPFGREAEAVAAIRQRDQDILDMCALVDRFLAPSQFLRRQYIEFGIPPEKILYWPYGFDHTPWPDQKERPPVRLPIRFGYIGTWMPSKGVDVLVRAFRSLPQTQATLDLHGFAVNYHGIDDYEETLLRLADGADNIRFRGAFEPHQLLGLLAKVDVLVVPSVWYENAPLTIHEAFLAGIPVVTSDHGGMAELVTDGVSGWTFRPGDHEDLARVLHQVLAAPEEINRRGRSVPAVRTVEDDGDSLLAEYRRLTA